MKNYLFLCCLLFIANSYAQKARVLTTTTDRSQDLTWSVQKLKAKSDAKTTILLHPGITYQTMQGFGAAITGSSAYCLLAMKAEDRTRFLRETFSPKDGFGCSYVRVSIGCSDFSLKDYTCCDTPGIEHFALTEEETKYVIPVLKEILAINPQLKVLASPWTCPLWMKDYSKYPIYKDRPFTAGQVRPEYYADYAMYFVKWIKAFESAGVPIEAITLQNEPLNNKNSASTVMFWDEQLAFLKVIGPAFRTADIGTKIYAYDHNYNYDKMESQKGYPLHIYADAEASQYVAGAAYHDYGGNRKELLDIQAKAPDKELIFTEASIGTWNKGHDLNLALMHNMETIGIGAVNNGCVGVLMWNLMLQTEFIDNAPDNRVGGSPNRDGGCKTCFGAVDLNIADLKTIYRNSHYYMICQLSAVIKPGAKRIAVEVAGALDGMSQSAFLNPDGTKALVILNKNDVPQVVRIQVENFRKSLTLTIPAKAVVSTNF